MKSKTFQKCQKITNNTFDGESFPFMRLLFYDEKMQ